MSITAIVILGIGIAVLVFVLWFVIANHRSSKRIQSLDIQIKNLIKTYNNDTDRLQKDNQKLSERNLDLSEKIRDIEADLLWYKTKYKSVKTDLERFMSAKKPCEHKCERHCMHDKSEPKKRWRKPKAK